jgi:hypothetical protein
VVEGYVENTNLPKGSIRVVWEILPGDSEHVFREIELEDFDPSLFSPDVLLDTSDFPVVPHPLLNPADDCLDRVWTQTVIKINYQSAEWFGEYEL